MTVRYRSLSEFQTPPRIEVTGTALEIFESNSFVPGTYASPVDVFGCTAQFNGLVWSGFLGVFSALASLTSIPVAYMGPSCTAAVVIDGIAYTYMMSGSQLVIKPTGFVPVYNAGVPATADLPIVAGIPQRVALPSGSSFRAVWAGFGPFAYRQGDSTVIAVSTDAKATVGYDQIIQRVGSSTHISVYGLGSGTLYLEGGNGA